MIKIVKITIEHKENNLITAYSTIDSICDERVMEETKLEPIETGSHRSGLREWP